MEVHNSSDFLFLIAVLVNGDKLLLIVGFSDNGEEKSLNAQRRLDNVGNVLLVCLRVKVFEGLAACFDMLSEVVVCSVGNAPKLAPTEREEIFKVCCGF